MVDQPDLINPEIIKAVEAAAPHLLAIDIVLIVNRVPQPAQLAVQCHRGLVAIFQGSRHLLEIGCFDPADIRADENISVCQQLNLPRRIIAHHKIRQLIHHRKVVIQLVTVFELIADVDRNHDIRAHLLDHRYRQIVGDPAIHQQLVTQRHRWQNAWYRHAGLHHLGQIAIIEHHRL